MVGMLFLLMSCATAQQQSMNVELFSKSIAEQGAQILDVRTSAEYNSGFIKNTLQANWNDQAEFNDRTQHLDKLRPVYVYCASGVRSAAATQALIQRGFKAYNLEGGIIAWKRAGLPVEGVSMAGKLSAETYAALTSSSQLVLIDFGATWCPPCKKMEPVIAALKQKQLVQVQLVDGGVNTDIMNVQKVEALPTFILYRSGKEVWRKQGLVSLDEFLQVIKSHS